MVDRESSQDMDVPKWNGLFSLFCGVQDGTESNISLENDQDFPESIHIEPNPHTVPDTDLVLIARACIHTLSQKHGLEQALDIVHEAVYGRLANGARFDTQWVNSEDDEPTTDTS